MKTTVNLPAGVPFYPQMRKTGVNLKNGDHKYLLHHRKRKRDEL